MIGSECSIKNIPRSKYRHKQPIYGSLEMKLYTNIIKYNIVFHLFLPVIIFGIPESRKYINGNK